MLTKCGAEGVSKWGREYGHKDEGVSNSGHVCTMVLSRGMEKDSRKLRPFHMKCLLGVTRWDLLIRNENILHRFNAVSIEGQLKYLTLVSGTSDNYSAAEGDD